MNSVTAYLDNVGTTCTGLERARFGLSLRRIRILLLALAGSVLSTLLLCFLVVQLVCAWA